MFRVFNSPSKGLRSASPEHFLLSIKIGKIKKVYERSPLIRGLISKGQLEETPPIRSKSRSKLKANPTPSLMARNNEIA